MSVSASSLESPSSLLHCSLNTSGKKPWFLAAEVCSLCVTLRQPCCFDTEQTKIIHRQFQCSNYNCMVSVLCKRQPAVKFYERLFQDNLWSLIFDCEKTYTLYIDAQGKSSTRRHLVAPSMENISGLTARTCTLNSYNPLFLRTLSDNPLKYDLLDNTAEEEIITQEIILRDNELNAHPCVSSISALLCHLSSLTDDQAPYWITKMAATLMADTTPVNIKWFLSQIIVNGKDEIRKYSSLLLRPLAAVVVNTAQIQDGGKYLNGLHIEILRTLHTWSEDSNLCADTLSECVRLLVDTCYFHKHRKYVRKSVLSTMEELVGNCGGGGTVPLEAITRDSDDATKEVSLEIQILFTKNNIYIPGLLKHVTDHIKYFDDYPTKTIELSKLFGLAVKTCQSDSEKSDSLRKFHAFLDKKRSNFNAYVKILYYTQVECHECVDDNSFSHITDLAPKMTTTHKDKCYTILSNYISHVRERDDHIIEMFASINIPEFILEKDAYIGVNLAKNGLTLLDNSVKKQIVSLVCEVCDTCNWKIRKVCYELLLNAYRDILNEQPSEPSAKRGNITKASSIISCVTSSDVYTRNVLGTLGRALMDQHHVIHSQVFDGFIQILDKSDLATRFCEILSLTMVLPFSRNSGNRETTSAMGGRCVATAVKLWLHVFRDNDNFRRKLLRENPLQISSSLNDDVPSKLLTMSKTYQGTFRSNSVVPSRSVRGDAAKGNKNVLNVQVPVDVLLEKLIVFAENNLAVSSEFFLEVFNMVLAICTEQQTKPILRDLVSCLLQNSPPVLLGTTIQMARALMDQCVDVHGLVKNAERLRARYVGSEAEMITRLLHEEAMLHTSQAVVLSSLNEQDFSMLEHNDEFSLKDVAAMFGKLANWEDLTLQSTERFRNGQLPVLWTDDQRFTHALENYSDNSWICKARDVYLGNTIKTFDWLSEAGAWPINFFQLSTITEAIDIKSQLNDEENDLSNVLCDHVLTQRQCLAQWSVRLMLRSVMTKQLSSNSDSQTLNCRSSELKWCMEANRRGLDSMALQCIQRNQRQLVASESLPWLLQQVHALTSRGLRLGQREDLRKALHKSETYLDSFRNVSDKETIFSMNRVILQLKYQMNLLSEENLEPILTEMSEEFSEQSHKSEHVMSELRAAHKIAFLYFCDNLDTPEESQYVNIVRNALKVLKDIFNLKLVSNLDGPVAYILHKLNKITNTNIYNECATRIIDVLDDHVEYLDNIILEETNRILTKLPQDSHEKYVKLQKKLFKDPANIIRLKLLRSPDYTLEQYVSSLLAAVQKQGEYEWNQTFVKIISNLYEVKEGGASYRLLTKYRPHLEGIRAYDSCEKFRKNAERVLKNILKSLKPQQVQQHLLLNDVCPSLCELGRSLSDAHRRDLDDLLRLPRGLSVLRFDKQLKVFTNSVKRPVLLRAVLSDGSSKSFLVKTGEDLRTDAGAQFVQNYCNTLTLTRAVTYNVTPLGADAGVIHYLEGHVTVRDLLLAHYPHINQIANNRVKDEQLILQTQTARHNQYNEICKKVPSFALRNCIINECESVEDFISKKSNYLTSLTSLTINHWILGVGDRHLENVLYARGSGAVCGVDWAAILEHTVHAYSHAPELTPARLTRNMLSVVQDISLLESRLQMNLKSLRDDHKMLTAIMSVAFQFMADPNSDTFQQKLKHIENKLKGSVLPFEVTRAVLSGSNVLHKHAYLQLLDQLFGHVRQRDTYTIEEQIYYLLRQCIDESIMQVTRSGWEPWL